MRYLRPFPCRLARVRRALLYSLLDFEKSVADPFAQDARVDLTRYLERANELYGDKDGANHDEEADNIRLETFCTDVLTFAVACLNDVPRELCHSSYFVSLAGRFTRLWQENDAEEIKEFRADQERAKAYREKRAKEILAECDARDTKPESLKYRPEDTFGAKYKDGIPPVQEDYCGIPECEQLAVRGYKYCREHLAKEQASKAVETAKQSSPIMGRPKVTNDTK